MRTTLERMAALVEVLVRLAGPEGRTRPTQWPADATVRVVSRLLHAIPLYPHVKG